MCGDNVRFISLIERRLIDKLHADEIWNGKSHQQIKSGKYILVSEFVQAFRLFCYIKREIKNKDNYTVIIENSPAGGSHVL